MASIFAVLLPITETTRMAVMLKGNRAFRCTVSALQSPLREAVEELCKPEGPVVVFDPSRLRGENGLVFGSSRSNHIWMQGPEITPHQFLLYLDPSTRCFHVKNVSSDKPDASTNATVKGTNIIVRHSYGSRTIKPGDTMALEDKSSIVAGQFDLYRFKVLLHPGTLDALLERRIDDFIQSMPDMHADGGRSGANTTDTATRTALDTAGMDDASTAQQDSNNSTAAAGAAPHGEQTTSAALSRSTLFVPARWFAW